MEQSYRVKNRESGSAMVEFAAVILPVMALVLMLMDVAWILFAWGCIQEGAREGARLAITGSCTLVGANPCTSSSESNLDQAIRQQVVQYSFGFVTTSNASSLVSVDYYPSTGYSSSGSPTSLNGQTNATATNNIVKVTVHNVTIDSFGPIFRTWVPISLAASASDVLQ
jgi:Flp pilus assembly protein TadG